MGTGSKIAAVIFAIFLVFSLYQYIKTNPETLSLANLNKSSFTIGLLAVGLIVFITIVVMLLRNG